MRLELATFPVTDVRFGSRTRLADGVLEVDRDEILALAGREATFFGSVGVEVARPGERTRIIHVLDAIEPRVKVAPAEMAEDLKKAHVEAVLLTAT